ncbi:hypothetical protein Aduo_012197 [Ancylostoma duodenale]
MTSTRKLRRTQQPISPLFGDKTVVQLEIFGRMWPGILDTESEVSILPAKVLLQAEADGVDIDSDVVEHAMDKSKHVYDASGSRISFVTIAEVNIRESHRSDVVRSKMHVSKSHEDMVIIGTNVLPRLGYKLVREPRLTVRHSSPSAMKPSAMQTNRHAAVVAQRAYIPPRTVGCVRLKGCARRRDWMLNASVAMIESRAWRADEEGIVKVPVVNRTHRPIVFRTGEVVGQWEKPTEQWREVEVKDSPPHVVNRHAVGITMKRLPKPKELLAGNRKDGQLSVEPTRPKTRSHQKRRVERVRVGTVNVGRTVTVESETDFCGSRSDRRREEMDEMRCSHARLHRHSQELPEVEEVPRANHSTGDCNVTRSADNMIPELPEPARSFRVKRASEGCRKCRHSWRQRRHIKGFLKLHREPLPLVIGKLPVESSVVDPTSHSFAEATVVDPSASIAERHARMVYEPLKRQLASFLLKEKPSSPKCPCRNVLTGAPSTSASERGYPATKEARNCKSRQRSRNKRKRRRKLGSQQM